MNETEKKKVKQAVETAEEILGSKEAVAELCRVTRDTVRKWGNGYVEISFKNAYLIDEATNGRVKIADLIPTHPVKRLPR